MCELIAEDVFSQNFIGRWVVNDIAITHDAITTFFGIDAEGDVHINPSDGVDGLIHTLVFCVTEERVVTVDFAVTFGDRNEVLFQLLVERVVEEFAVATEIAKPLRKLKDVVFHPDFRHSVNGRTHLSPETVSSESFRHELISFESDSNLCAKQL